MPGHEDLIIWGGILAVTGLSVIGCYFYALISELHAMRLEMHRFRKELL